MRTPPAGLAEADLSDALRNRWGIDPTGLEWVPVGGGSHHWIAIDASGARRFVTADDLDHKPFLGDTRDEAFDGLRSALEAARRLSDDAHLDHVVAPERARDGEILVRLSPRYAVALYPFVDGRPGAFGEEVAPTERAELVQMLVGLHAVTPARMPGLRPARLDPPRRRDLERALRELDEEWSGGPYSRRVRDLLAGRSQELRRFLDRFDRLERNSRTAELVISHGEIHGGNLVDSPGGLRLIDWDTVALASPERDLWTLAAEDGEALRMYSDASARPVDRDRLAFYRMRWRVDDISSFVHELRSHHVASADTEHWWSGLLYYLDQLEA